MQLHTERLIIRDPEWDDFPDYHRLMSDPNTMYYINDMLAHSEDESRKNLSEAIAETAGRDRKKYFFSILRCEDKKYIGNIGYTVLHDTPAGKIVSGGYHILPEYQKKGYTTEGFRELLRFAFEENNVYRFTADCFTENRASERVMQKCGMIHECYMKECTWHDGKLKDRVSYRLLKPEWLAGQKNWDNAFWSNLDRLVSESKIIIDRPRDSRHPKYPDFIYPVDYGCLENTTSMDGSGIDIWKGTNSDIIDAIICTIDLLKKDSEIKILIGCSEKEKQLILAAHNDSEYMKGIMIRRR